MRRIRPPRKEDPSSALTIAIGQFPVSRSIRRNAEYIEEMARRAHAAGAAAAHFPEASLSGYAGADFDNWKDFNSAQFTAAMEHLMVLAETLKLWLIVGGAHRLSGRHLPHNSVYVISNEGRLVDRYDKRFCTETDLRHYTPGDHPVVFSINGVRCGVLICHEVRYPELFRDYKRRGVQLLFQSFYNARAKGPSHHTWTIPPTLQAHCASNYYWSSVSNASGYYQSWSSRLIRPDGIVQRKLPQHRTALIIERLDMQQEFRDASRAFRPRAMKGIWHSGTLVSDPRSRARTSL